MPTIKKKLMSKPDVVSDKVRSYGNDPFFIQKTKASKAFLEKHGFPKELTSGSSRKTKSKT